MHPQYPFPGMDPYLETPDIWPDFHDALAGAIRAELNAHLPEPYYARLQMRPEMGVILEAGTKRWIVPDVVVMRPPRRAPQRGVVVVLESPRTMLSEGVEVRVHTDPIRHQFVEIRDAARGHKLITLIEIVSPSNKKPGTDRRAYETKQREVLDSDAHLIELDLQRSGRRLLPYPELAAAVDTLACDYLILLNRAELRQDTWMDYVLYPVDVRESLPTIPVPLTGDDPDVPLDIQYVVQKCYLEGPYVRALDYDQPPEPPLDAGDAVWLDAVLREAGLKTAL